MGSANAFIMVGKPGFFHGGLHPTHCLMLFENDKPAWVLIPIIEFSDVHSKNRERIVWIPTVEHMLEDALLMIGIYVLKDKGVTLLADKIFKNKKKDQIWLYDDIDQQDLGKLREVCKKYCQNTKLKLLLQ